MARLIRELTARAERFDAALALFDHGDRVVTANDNQRRLYPFVDFSGRLTYGDIVRSCVRHGKLDEPSVCAEPQRWIDTATLFRRFTRFSQSLTRHADGRIVQVTYERLEGTGGWWYQMRRDVTAGFLRGVRAGEDPIRLIAGSDGPEPSAGAGFLARLLDALPQPAALITTGGHVVSGNFRFADLLSRGDGLSMERGRVCLTAAPDGGRAMAGRAAWLARRRRTPLTLRVPRRDRRPPYIATLAPPPVARLGWDGPADGILGLTVVDPDAVLAVPPRLVADMLGITGTEAAVVLALAAGRTPAEVAADLDMEPRAVGRHLASVVDRTGLRSRAAAVRQATALACIFGPRC